MFTKYADWSSEQRNRSSENNILRLSVGSISDISTDEIIVPSNQFLNIVDAEFKADATDSTFTATKKDDTFGLFVPGLVFKVTGSTSNDGLWRVISKTGKYGVNVEGIDNQVVADELDIVAGITATNYRDLYRAFGFDVDVTIQFNGDDTKHYDLLKGDVLYLTDSMVYFAVSADATLYWSY